MSSYGEEIASKYKSGKYNSSELAREYNCTCGSIFYILEKFGVPRRDVSDIRRKYTLDETYFDKMDTPQAIYWFGLLLADGCHYPENTISLFLQERDSALLEALNVTIGSNKPLTVRKEKKGQGSCGIIMHSKKIAARLNDLGIVKKKTFLTKWPEWLEERFYQAFLLGCWDGDGWVGKNTGISYIGTLSLCESIATVFREKTGVNCFVKKAGNEGSDTFVALVAGRTQSVRVLEWLYSGGVEIFLERKYQRFLDMKDKKRKNAVLNENGEKLNEEEIKERNRLNHNAYYQKRKEDYAETRKFRREQALLGIFPPPQVKSTLTKEEKAEKKRLYTKAYSQNRRDNERAKRLAALNTNPLIPPPIPNPNATSPI